jgi:hypothetical protein
MTDDLPTIDLAQLERDKQQNFEERLKFIDFYAAWVKKTPNTIWARQQEKLITSGSVHPQHAKP